MTLGGRCACRPRGCARWIELLVAIGLFGFMIGIGGPLLVAVGRWLLDHPLNLVQVGAYGVVGWGVSVGIRSIRLEREQAGQSPAQRRVDRARDAGAAATRRRARKTTRRIRFGVLRVGVPTCACCFGGIGPTAPHWICPGCGAWQHADCAAWVGRCGRYGCAPSNGAA